MLLEDLLLVVVVGIVVLLLGRPIVRLLQTASWRQKDPLAEAKERLRIAKIEAEVARVNRETERIYEGLYEDTLKEGPAATGTRIAPGEESAAPEGEEREGMESTFERGKRNGQE